MKKNLEKNYYAKKAKDILQGVDYAIEILSGLNSEKGYEKYRDKQTLRWDMKILQYTKKNLDVFRTYMKHITPAKEPKQANNKKQRPRVQQAVKNILEDRSHLWKPKLSHEDTKDLVLRVNRLLKSWNQEPVEKQVILNAKSRIVRSKNKKNKLQIS